MTETPAKTATLIRDLIDIPARVHQGDFVLNLAAGVERAEETLRQYVVTPQLAEAFDNALAFIGSALEARSSKAAYLHGSFGSGKSHFMAVLHLLLNRDRRARSIPDLGRVLTRHEWLEGASFLLVPYHMIGADSMESAVLGGYVDHVRKLHPEAPIPAVYLTEELFANARAQRERMGDPAFFATLNEGSAGGGDDEWGDMEGGWDAAGFEAAMAAPAGDPDRAKLVSDLVRTHFPAFTAVARGDKDAFVSLDQGLSIISHHARDLGYSAIVLFLDELILWLASRASDLDFLNREAQKLAKLVESQHADRPAPIVSFVARQRDLRELVGEDIAGAEQVRLSDTLRWFEGRFHRITLEDRNLPTIVQRRLLRPRDEGAREELDAAFERATRVRAEVLEALLTHEGDREMFRQVYPFSPALVQALVALSSVLQRHRTALRIMLQLLVEQRDRLCVGDIIPVGDLWDVIARGAEPFSPEMLTRFKAAQRLYQQKLRPLIEREHGINLDEVDPSDRGPAATEARLAKTLLLAALVPEVEAFKGLTAARLAALNHGTIRSPIPGREAAEVLRRVQAWARRVGEIKLAGDETRNPVITIQLTGVDVQGLLDAVAVHDNEGGRKRKLKELLFDQLGLPDPTTETVHRHVFSWRGTERECEILFANVRELTDESLATPGEGWRLICDYPFDTVGYGPDDDVERAERFLAQRPRGAHTLLWLPRFFSAETREDLGTLVRIDYLLSGENFERHAAHLSVGHRTEAREVLRSQQSSLRVRIGAALAAAYGLGNPEPGVLDPSHEHTRFLVSLLPGFEPRLPPTGKLADALHGLLDAALSYTWPNHPRFPEPVRPGALRKTWQVIQVAAADPDRRAPVDKALRPQVQAIAEPLGLGTQGETHFVLSTRWRDDLERRRHQAGVEEVSVRALRDWLDPDDARTGLTREVADLLILTYAALTNRAFRLHGGPLGDADVGRLPDEATLRAVALPDEATWKRAGERAVELFGVTASPLVNAANVERLVVDVKARIADAPDAPLLAERIVGRAEQVGVAPDAARGWDRVRAAEAVAGIVAALGPLDGTAFVERLAALELPLRAEVLGNALRKAGAIRLALDRSDAWHVLAALRDHPDPEAAAILDELRQDLAATELASPLGRALDVLTPRALRLLRPPMPPPPPRREHEAGDGEPAGATWATLGQGAETRAGWDAWDRARAAIEALRRDHPDARVSLTWRVEKPEGGQP